MPQRWTGAKASQDQTGLAKASGNFSHAEGGQSTASGDFSHAEGSASAVGSTSHAEGAGTAANGAASHAEGSFTQANNSYAHAEGSSTLASGLAAHAEGDSTAATGNYSHAEGNFSVARRVGQRAKTAGKVQTNGDAQINDFVAMRSTTNATPVELWFDAAASTTAQLISTNNVLTVPLNRGHRFRIEAIARRFDGSGSLEFAAWTITGTIVRGPTGSAFFIATPQVVTEATTGATSWLFDVTADNADATNNYLKLTVTGEVGKSIKWVAGIYTTEVG